ncbi:MAG: hypothetical protein COC15_02120 [Legionellales bacterium]|nr:MAG: hypothetical protein COC15_02120 [Legionellales bacterium]
MRYKGIVSKLESILVDPIKYYLPIGDSKILLNDLLGKQIQLSFTGTISCTACARVIKKTFRGYCYPCSQSLAAADMCILKPELCHFHLGTCREPSWGQQHCMQTHVVYIANSSGLKVGITRAKNIPMRWIDQGAVQAIPLYKVATRYMAGIAEVVLAQKMADKTNWRKMLQGNIDLLDLTALRDEIIKNNHAEVCAALQAKDQDISKIARATDSVVTLNYPVLEYPIKIKSYNFDKTPDISDVIVGIKGQYLIFKNAVLNVRKFAGYELVFSGFE